MTKEEAKEFYPILQAFAEGEAIECRTKPSALSQNQSIVHSRMQKSAGQKCKSTSLLGG